MLQVRRENCWIVTRCVYCWVDFYGTWGTHPTCSFITAKFQKCVRHFYFCKEQSPEILLTEFSESEVQEGLSSMDNVEGRTEGVDANLFGITVLSSTKTPSDVLLLQKLFLKILYPKQTFAILVKVTDTHSINWHMYRMRPIRRVIVQSKSGFWLEPIQCKNASIQNCLDNIINPINTSTLQSFVRNTSGTQDPEWDGSAEMQ